MWGTIKPVLFQLAAAALVAVATWLTQHLQSRDALLSRHALQIPAALAGAAWVSYLGLRGRVRVDDPVEGIPSREATLRALDVVYARFAESPADRRLVQDLSRSLMGQAYDAGDSP